MNWAIKIPYRDRDTPLDAESIWQLPKLLDGEDALTCRELLAVGYRAGAERSGRSSTSSSPLTSPTAGFSSTAPANSPG